MRKFLLVVIFMLLASTVFADGNPTAVNEYTYTIRNNATTPKTTLISTDIIRPGVDKITSYKVIPAVAGSNGEMNIAIYDSSTVNANSELIAEDEKSGQSAGERFYRPRKILNGLWVYQGCMSTAIISFIRE